MGASIWSPCSELSDESSFLRLTDTVFAVGKNADNLGQGFQIGGGDASYGPDGNLFASDGHSSWTRVQPSRNESSIEFNIYPSSGQGVGQAQSGTNIVNRISGSPFPASWVGKKFYFNEEIYRVASVINSSSLTVTTAAGAPVVFGSTFSEIYHVVYVKGTGNCKLLGNTVQRLTGDPFVPFVSDPSFVLKIDGVVRTVTSFVSIDQLTISTALVSANSTYDFELDINDQIVTFRLQKLVGGDEENLSFWVRYDGYWIHSLFAGQGKYRKVVLGAGERAPGDLARQIILQKNGDLTICGDYGYDAIRVLNQPGFAVNRFELQAPTTGFNPAWRARGSDSNVGMGFDTQGTGSFGFTCGSFARTVFQVFGSSNGTSWLAVGASNTGAPILSAQGAASILDVQLAPKGSTGRVWLGEWVSNVDAAVNGYVWVKDFTGVPRKLATIA